MFALIIIAVSRIRRFVRTWAPSNILLDWLQTRRGLEWGTRAMLIGVLYFAVAYWCTVLIDNGGPGWLHLIVLVGVYNGFRFLFNGPVSLVRLRAARRREGNEQRLQEQVDEAPEALAPVAQDHQTRRAPTGHEALPHDEHGPTYRGRASGALQA